MEKFPFLKNNQVAVLRAESASGIVCDEQFHRCITKNQKTFTVFQSIEDAGLYIDKIMATQSDFEFVIYGPGQRFLKFISKYQ